MDGLVLYCLLISLLSITIYGVGKVSHSLWWKPKRLERMLRQQGINGTQYKLLVGEMKGYIRMITVAWSKPINLTHQIVSRVDPFTSHVVQEYGKISMSWNGNAPRVIISDPELMKEVLSNKLGHIRKPPLNPLILVLARGLTVLEGEKWAVHRRLINPAFHMEKLKGMIPVFASACNEMLQQWKNKISDESAFEIDIWHELKKLAKDIISRAAFGSSYEEGKMIFQLQEELVILTIEAMQSLYIPGLRFVPTKKNLRRKSLDTQITSMLRDLVQRKQNTIRSGQSKVDDLLSLLLHSSEQENSVNSMTIEEVTMILNEVLRLYPPAIALYQHTYKETKIGDLEIPPRVDLLLPTMLIHRDPEFWGDDAEEFRPERFSEGISKAAKNHLAFFPFGWGPRTCIGQNFALLEAKTVLAMVLQLFSFELSPSYSHAPYTIMTLQPQHGAQIIIQKI